MDNKEVIKKCETCKFFLIQGCYGMDCLNDSVSQEEYERCLGESGENCEGWSDKIK